MEGMFLIGRIIVIAGFVKRRLAIPVFMNVHTEETGSIRILLIGQMKDLNLNNNALGIGVIKRGESTYGTDGISSYFCYGSRPRGG